MYTRASLADDALHTKHHGAQHPNMSGRVRQVYLRFTRQSCESLHTLRCKYAGARKPVFHDWMKIAPRFAAPTDNQAAIDEALQAIASSKHPFEVSLGNPFKVIGHRNVERPDYRALYRVRIPEVLELRDTLEQTLNNLEAEFISQEVGSTGKQFEPWIDVAWADEEDEIHRILTDLYEGPIAPGPLIADGIYLGGGPQVGKGKTPFRWKAFPFGMENPLALDVEQ